MSLSIDFVRVNRTFHGVHDFPLGDHFTMTDNFTESWLIKVPGKMLGEVGNRRNHRTLNRGECGALS